MKAIILGLIFTFSGSILLAQTDSNKVTTDSMHNNMNMDTTHNMNMNMDTMHNNMNMTRDTSGNMNNSSINASNNSMDTTIHLNAAQKNMSVASLNSAEMSNPMDRQPGQPGYVGLPLYMTFVSDDVKSKLTTQFGTALYSITAIKRANADNGYVVHINKDGQQMQIETVDANGAVVPNQ